MISRLLVINTTHTYLLQFRCDCTMLSMIFAADENGAIGKDGDLPWRQSSDLQYFKQLTLDKTIVMGRKTWESLPGKLPRRRHLVMS